MSIESLNNMTQLMQRLHFPEEEASGQNIPSIDSMESEARKDTLELSVQAQQALEKLKPFAKADPLSAEVDRNIKQTDNQGNSVRISEQAKALASSIADSVAWEPDIKNPLLQHQLTSITEDGTAVSVGRINDMADGVEKGSYALRFTDASGTSHEFNFTGDVTMSMDETGAWNVYFSETNITKTYGASGVASEAEGNTLLADANTIYVNTSGKALAAGNGNNLIFAYADGTEITGGSGNDKLILRDDISHVTFNAGDGNDSVYSETHVNRSNINMGSGDNSVNIKSMNGGRLTAGDGDNRINMSSISRYASIELGDGNNKLNILQVGYATSSYFAVPSYGADLLPYNDASIILGNGDNTLAGHGIYASITVGDGNNTLDYHGLNMYGSVKLGDGVNSVSLHQINDNGSLSAGNGQNTFKLNSIRGQGRLTAGHGDNSVIMHSVHDEGQMTLGNGANTVLMHGIGDNAGLIFGNGDNKLDMAIIDGSASVSFGDGHNIIRISYLREKGDLSAGDGANLIYVQALSNQARLNLGDGDNTVIASEIKDNAAVNMGDGANMFFAERFLGNASLMGGSGQNIFIFKALLGGMIKSGKDTDIGIYGENAQLDDEWDRRMNSKHADRGLDTESISASLENIFTDLAQRLNSLWGVGSSDRERQEGSV